MQTKTFSQAGFTLIEILAVMLITAIITGVGYMAYTKAQSQQGLKVSAEKVKMGLNKAKQFAQFGKKPPIPNCVSLLGYQFSTSSAANTYTITAVCSGSINYNEEVGNLDNNVSINDIAPVIFNSIGQDTNLAGNLTITISNNDGSISKTVTVTSTGEIQ